ncbi:MAG: ABC transporter permease, partial [Halomonas sp.]|nr:ABC transporter permease [Halomonas sp.]
MSFFARFAQNRGALVGLVILLAIVLMAILAPLLYPESPWRMVQRPFLAPLEAEGFWLGTDTMGRDVAAGLMHGAWVSLLIGLISTSVALLIGVPLGAVAGYY